MILSALLRRRSILSVLYRSRSPSSRKVWLASGVTRPIRPCLIPNTRSGDSMGYLPATVWAFRVLPSGDALEDVSDAIDADGQSPMLGRMRRATDLGFATRFKP